MNPSRLLLPVAALTFGLALSAFADEVQGVVDSVDSSANAVVVKDPASGTSRTVRVHPKVASGLGKGSVVKAKLKPGSDEADSVEVLLTR
ncbi:MAG TPA: hypothetical protein VL404_06745 [Candidatus Eisenbacteria bacterium]|nr:hypothetical protein [Candidatus Eisenbacteria bacterium]